MAQRIKLLTLAATAALALGAVGMTSVANAHAAASPSVVSDGSSEKNGSAADTQAYEQVDSFVMFRRPYSWQPVDDKTVILWATPFDAYLVELAFPSHDMKFVQGIGVSSTGSRVYAKFDAVTIRGFRYPINSIFKLSREEAKNLTERHKGGNS